MSKSQKNAQGATVATATNVSLLNSLIARKYKTGAVRYVDCQLAEGIVEFELERAWIVSGTVKNINKDGKRPLLKLSVVWSDSCPLEDAGTSFSIETVGDITVGQTIDLSAPIFFKKKLKEVHFNNSWYPEFKVVDGVAHKIEAMLNDEGHIVDYGYVAIPTQPHQFLGATSYIKCNLTKSVAPVVKRERLVISKL